MDWFHGTPTLGVLAGSCWATQYLKGAQQGRSYSIFLQGPLKKQTSARDGTEGSLDLAHVWQPQGLSRDLWPVSSSLSNSDEIGVSIFLATSFESLVLYHTGSNLFIFSPAH